MINLYPHQVEALDKLGTGSILCAGVGTGKSITSLAYYYTKECKGVLNEPFSEKDPKPLYIITTAKKRDSCEWEDDMSGFDIQSPVTIDSWNNIEKYIKVTDAFFIFDEQRVVGYGAWTKSFIRIARKNHWILLSATPGDRWIDYMPVFIANGFYMNKTDFCRWHVIFNRFAKYPQIERYVNVDILEEHRDKILVVINYKKSVIKQRHDILVDYDTTMYNTVMRKRWNLYSDSPCKTVAELCQTLRRVVNENPYRIKAFLDILKDHKKVIVFYNFTYELNLMKEALDIKGIPYWELNGKVHDPLPDNDIWVYLVQYAAGAEGWNCILTDTIIFFSLNYSYRTTVQAAGRIDRMNTPFSELHYYYISTNSSIDRAIARCMANKKKFNEKNFISM